jgi:competence protein ComEA
LATLVNEGEQIYIPKRGEKPRTITSRPQLSVGDAASNRVTGGGEVATRVININLASATELEQLPGVGPATAKAIVAYREKYGAFNTVEDLLKVRGIGPAKLSEILPRASVR